MSDSKNLRRQKIFDWLYTAIAALFVFFQLYTTLFGVLPGLAQRGVHLGFMLGLLYLSYFGKSDRKVGARIADVLFLMMAIASVTYVILINDSYQLRSGMTIPSDIVFGIMLLVVLLDATRRSMGWSLTIIASLFVVYAFAGKYLPGIFAFGGYKLSRFIHTTVFTSDGIMGSTLSVCATYIVLFIILGAVFQETGVGNYFTSLTTAAFGRLRGGPAKVSVIASALFGSISGSSVANVVGTGSFTIPMMKKIGFEPEYAGAVEAAASTGGQIMPPIMGAAAFVMAEMIDVAYSEIVKSAWIPALLYFTAILIMIDLHARRYGIMGAKAEDLPVFKQMIKDIYLLFPIIFLIVLLTAFNFSVSKAGMYTLIFTIVLVMLKRSSRLNLEKLKRIAISSARGTIPVAVACGVVGIISAVVMGSGLGFRLSNILIKLSGGHLLVLLFLTMLTSIVLGMGLPTTPAYMILASLVAPALIQLGVPAIAAHMFIFYFGIISNVTPPVAMAAYAAAGISGGNPLKTGFQSFKLALSGFLLPFLFIYNPVLLMQGSFLDAIWPIITALIGIYCLSAFIEGYYLNREIKIVERILLFVAALSLIDSGMLTDFVGIGLAVCVYFFAAFRTWVQVKHG